MIDGVRLARSAPWAGLGRCAERAGMTTADLQRVLSSLPARGRCGDLSTVMTAPQSPAEFHALAMAHPASPPATVRAARQGRPAPISASGAGTASWATRGLETAAPARHTAIRQASTPNHDCPEDHNPLPGADSHPPALLYALAGHLDATVRQRAAVNRRSPPQLLAIMTRDDHYLVRETAAANPSCLSETLERLLAASNKNGEDIVQWVGSNPSCPPHLLERLFVAASDPYTRMVVAANPSSGAALIERAAADDEETVAAGAAINPSCPPRLLERLAGHDSYEVRRATAINPSTPRHVLQRLPSADAACNHAVDWEEGGPLNPALEGADLLRVAGLYMGRSALLAHPNCPTELLKVEASSPETPPWDLAAIAENPNCPPAILSRLAAHSNPDVAWNAADRLRCWARTRARAA